MARIYQCGIEFESLSVRPDGGQFVEALMPACACGIPQHLVLVVVDYKSTPRVAFTSSVANIGLQLAPKYEIEANPA
jgi:hypothetical protein